MKRRAPARTSGAVGELAAIYLRVSKGEQSTENQEPDVRRVAKARRLSVFKVYEEKISAGKKRPAFEAMLEDARRGHFRVLVIWALDRFGRSMVGNMQAVLELDRLGVQVVSVCEPWLDTGGPVRDLLVAIFSWVAEQERKQISARTRAGLERVRKKGIRLGRPRRRVDLQRVAELRAAHKSWRQVAEVLRVPLGTLHAAVKREQADAG